MPGRGKQSFAEKRKTLLTEENIQNKEPYLTAQTAKQHKQYALPYYWSPSSPKLHQKERKPQPQNPKKGKRGKGVFSICTTKPTLWVVK